MYPPLPYRRLPPAGLPGLPPLGPRIDQSRLDSSLDMTYCFRPWRPVLHLAVAEHRRAIVVGLELILLFYNSNYSVACYSSSLQQITEFIQDTVKQPYFSEAILHPIVGRHLL